MRVPHPPAPPGLPARHTEPEEDLRTDITARNIFDPQGTTHFDVQFIDSGGEYMYERMTTRAEREKGSLDLTHVFPQDSFPGDSSDDGNDIESGTSGQVG